MLELKQDSLSEYSHRYKNDIQILNRYLSFGQMAERNGRDCQGNEFVKGTKNQSFWTTYNQTDRNV